MIFILLILLAIVVVLAVWVVGLYDRLVTARNAFENAFENAIAQIDVQLQGRFDLVPSLVETAKACLSHERVTLEAVIAARGAWPVPPLRPPRQARVRLRTPCWTREGRGAGGTASALPDAP